MTPFEKSSSDPEMPSVPIAVGPLALLSKKFRTAKSILQAKGWTGIKEQVVYILNGRSGLATDPCYDAWARLRRLRNLSSTARQLLDSNSRMLLESFLASDSRLAFPACR